VFGGGGIYPDKMTPVRAVASPWLSRVEASLVVLKWAAGYVSAHRADLGEQAAMMKSPALPPGALADFRAMAAREGLTIPDGDAADRDLSRLLLPILVDAAWGEGPAYQVIAMTDPEVETARPTLP